MSALICKIGRCSVLWRNNSKAHGKVYHKILTCQNLHCYSLHIFSHCLAYLETWKFTIILALFGNSSKQLLSSCKCLLFQVLSWCCSDPSWWRQSHSSGIIRTSKLMCFSCSNHIHVSDFLTGWWTMEVQCHSWPAYAQRNSSRWRPDPNGERTAWLPWTKWNCSVHWAHQPSNQVMLCCVSMANIQLGH